MQISIKQVAKQTLEEEAQALLSLIPLLDEGFERAVRLISGSKSRVIVSGIGKSAIVAQKIAATFNSTATPALFMHAGDAIHGDLGMVQPGDVVILISNSGESPEIKTLAPLIKGLGNILIGMVGNVNSFLAKQSDCIINTTVAKEAGAIGLAPTNSTTAQMAMGDAIAVCLMEMTGFTESHFAKYHPGGLLGKKLYITVAQIIQYNALPKVSPQAGLKEVIMEMTAKRLGVTAVTNVENQLEGIITDGDLRRMLEKSKDHFNMEAKDIMTKNPKQITPGTLAINAFSIMSEHDISHLLVVEEGIYKGVLHIHDLIREGLC